MPLNLPLRPASRVVSRARKGNKFSVSCNQLSLISARPMATETNIPIESVGMDSQVKPLSTASNLTTPTSSHLYSYSPRPVVTTIYRFPTMEPLRHKTFPEYCLHLPLRKDILHRAVIFEGDATRLGTASTKWRSEVHGSNRKLAPQKGTGKARVGDKKSPIRKGGGVAFGPHPRDFSTKLPKKIYDLAWRTALSYRYRRGELLLVDQFRDLETAESWWLKNIFHTNGWGNAEGRSMLVGLDFKGLRNLKDALDNAGGEGRALSVADVDVKNLLSMGRVIIEVKALQKLLKDHSRDVVPSERLHEKYNVGPTMSLSTVAL